MRPASGLRAHAGDSGMVAQQERFFPYLLAMTYERMGRKAEADDLYKKAYDMATGHNPPAAFVRPFVRKKLGMSTTAK